MDDVGLVKGLTPVLIRYSEWLDQQGLIVSGCDSAFADATPRKQPGEDDRSHEDLVQDFLASKS